MNSMTRIAIWFLVVFWLSGCGKAESLRSSQSTGTQIDAKSSVETFGVDEVVRSLLAAQEKCIAAGYEDFDSCTEVRSAPDGVGLTARMARDTYKAFISGCIESLDRPQCDDIFTSAYVSGAIKVSTGK
jgi:hypothetical protein